SPLQAAATPDAIPSAVAVTSIKTRRRILKLRWRDAKYWADAPFTMKVADSSTTTNVSRSSLKNAALAGPRAATTTARMQPAPRLIQKRLVASRLDRLGL